MTFHRPRLIIVVWCFTCLLMVLRVLGAMGGWVGIKIFFRAILAVKRCLSRARCAAQARVALVHTYRGQASCRHRIGSSRGWLLLSSSSEQRTTSCTTASFFSQSLFLLFLFSGLPTICRGVWFSSFLGSVPAFAPVELAFTFFLHPVL